MDLDKLFEALSLSDDTELIVLFAEMAITKWTKKKILARNKSKKKCEICDCLVRRGGFAEHLTTKKHKKRVRRAILRVV